MHEINKCPTCTNLYAKNVGQFDESPYISGHKAVPRPAISAKNVGQSLGILEIIKVRRLQRSINAEAIENYRCFFDERAAILEFEAKFSGEEAERTAFSDIVELVASEQELSQGAAKYFTSSIV